MLNKGYGGTISRPYHGFNENANAVRFNTLHLPGFVERKTRKELFVLPLPLIP